MPTIFHPKTLPFKTQLLFNAYTTHRHSEEHFEQKNINTKSNNKRKGKERERTKKKLVKVKSQTHKTFLQNDIFTIRF